MRTGVARSRCDSCLYRCTKEQVIRRRHDIAALRQLAPSSLGAQTLSAEDVDLDDLLESLLAHGAPRTCAKQDGGPRALSNAAPPSTDCRGAETQEKDGVSVRNSRTFVLAEPLRSVCAHRLGSAGAGKMMRRLGIVRAPAVLCLHLRRVVHHPGGIRKGWREFFDALAMCARMFMHITDANRCLSTSCVFNFIQHS